MPPKLAHCLLFTALAALPVACKDQQGSGSSSDAGGSPSAGDGGAASQAGSHSGGRASGGASTASGGELTSSGGSVTNSGGEGGAAGSGSVPEGGAPADGGASADGGAPSGGTSSGGSGGIASSLPGVIVYSDNVGVWRVAPAEGATPVQISAHPRARRFVFSPSRARIAYAIGDGSTDDGMWTSEVYDLKAGQLLGTIAGQVFGFANEEYVLFGFRDAQNNRARAIYRAKVDGSDAVALLDQLPDTADSDVQGFYYPYLSTGFGPVAPEGTRCAFADWVHGGNLVIFDPRPEACPSGPCTPILAHTFSLIDPDPWFGTNFEYFADHHMTWYGASRYVGDDTLTTAKNISSSTGGGFFPWLTPNVVLGGSETAMALMYTDGTPGPDFPAKAVFAAKYSDEITVDHVAVSPDATHIAFGGYKRMIGANQRSPIYVALPDASNAVTITEAPTPPIRAFGWGRVE